MYDERERRINHPFVALWDARMICHAKAFRRAGGLEGPLPRFAGEAGWGRPSRKSHRHPVNGCFLPERGGVEGTPSTNRNFEPFPCFLLA
jgi:hypothetical protein